MTNLEPLNISKMHYLVVAPRSISAKERCALDRDRCTTPRAYSAVPPPGAGQARHLSLDSEARGTAVMARVLQAPVVVAGNDHWWGFRPGHQGARPGESADRLARQTQMRCGAWICSRGAADSFSQRRRAPVPKLVFPPRGYNWRIGSTSRTRCLVAASQPGSRCRRIRSLPS